MTFGDAGETKAKARVTLMWEFIERCKPKTSGSEALHDLLTRALTPAGLEFLPRSHVLTGERKPNLEERTCGVQETAQSCDR